MNLKLLIFCGSLTFAISFILHGLLFYKVMTTQVESRRNETKINEKPENDKDYLQLVDKIDEGLSQIILIKQQIDKKIEDKEKKEEDISEEINEFKWKRGCSHNGIFNGSSCVVFMNEKANYTDAVQICKLKKGVLLEKVDDDLMEALDKFSPNIPLLVDIKFDVIKGFWMNSRGKVASNLPWEVTSKGKNGNCVYIYQKHFKQWHCKALLNFICIFNL